MIKRFTLSLLNTAWTTTAFLVVTVAILVSVARLMLPGIDRYREPIARWVSEQAAQPVDFDSISASWRGWVPVIELTNVRLNAREGHKVITRFDKAQFSLDPWRSLKRREVVPGQMIVSGMQIALARSEDGSIRLEGTGDSDAADSGLKQNALAYWLQTQRHLTIEQAAITWHDQRLLKPLIFSNVALKIRSDGKRRQFEGRAHLPGSPESEFRFLLDARGDLLTTTWSGEMYLEGRGLEPSTLLEYRRWLGLEARGGRLDFQFWSDWQDARVIRVNGEFTAGGSEVGTREQRIRLDELSGTVNAIRTRAEQWQVAVDPLQVRTANGSWPASRIALAVTRTAGAINPEVQVNVGFVKLDDLTPVVDDITVVPPNVREAIARLQPRGFLRDLRLHYDPVANPQRSTTLNVRFEQLGFAANGQFPGVDGLEGTLAADTASGRLELDSRDISVHAPAVYDREVMVDTLQGNVGLVRGPDRWQLLTDGLYVANADLRTTVYGQLALAPGQPPDVSLYAQVEHLAPARIIDYLPRTGVKPKTRNWFTHAFQAGRVDAGAIVLRGPLDHFPFDEKKGRFEARLHVAGAELLFSPKWPAIRGIDAEVVFSGRGLTVTAPGGKTMDADIGKTSAVIPDLFAPEKTLLVEGTASAPLAATKQYLANGPLKDRLAEVVNQVTDSGWLELKLNLRIPLNPRKNDIEGTLTLRDVVVRPRTLGEDITSVNGQLSFTQDSFEAKELKGSFAGSPVLLSFRGTADKGDANAEIQLSGRGDAAYLNERLHTLTPALAAWLDAHNALEHLKGATDWRVTTRIARSGNKPSRVTDLRVHSSLAGMALDLPSPIGKTAMEARPLSIHLDLAKNEERGIDFNLGNQINGALLLRPDPQDPKGTARLARAALQFGALPASLPATDSLHIAGTVLELSINDWLDLLHERIALGSGTARTSTPPLPVSLDVTAARVQALGRHFDNVRVSGDSGQQAWRLKVAGPQIEGDVTVPHQLATAMTEVNLRHLQVPPRAIERTTPVEVNPGRLPPVSIRCEDFMFQNINFGRAELTTSPIPNGLKLNSLSFDSPSSLIRADGEWRYADEVHTSQFTIRVESGELAKLLGQFGYGVTAVEGGKTAIDINASWGGSPADFTLEKLHGSLAMTIKNGRFLDFDNPAAGRLFGLLSIQALPRRLTLDFKDLFGKGMGFERIAGNFELDGGNAYTNNLIMEGSSARIEITGRTGLAGQDYDQLATVTPQVSDSLPVAGAIFGPVGIGAGAAIFLGKQILPELPEQIDRMLARQYTITGSWKEPKVEQVHANTNTNESGARTTMSADG